MDQASISRIDARHVWHPYGAVPAADEPLVITGASGVRLEVADGRSLIDAMSSWWAAIHGYRHPVIDAAAHRQIESMSHVMFGGLTHEPAARLAQLLVAITPSALQRVFFADSGSVAVEVAVKMALQYWRGRREPGRTRLMTWRGGYHGDTFAPMSVCDPVGGMHAMWTDVLARQIFVDAPPAEYSADYVARLEAAVIAHRDELAAIIVEPLVQGAGGMRFHSPQLLSELRRICDRHSVLLIFDEIATGFGRTGELFAADHRGVSPDIMCVGKALTGGYLTLAATLCTDEVAEVISASEAGGLAHGPTFMANPLACAIAVASTELLLDGPWQQRVHRVGAGLESGLAPLRGRDGIREVRTCGAIGVVELCDAVDVTAATAAAVAAGVWLRPFGHLIYAMPPYLCEPADVAAITAAMTAAAEASIGATDARRGLASAGAQS